MNKELVLRDAVKLDEEEKVEAEDEAVDQEPIDVESVENIQLELDLKYDFLEDYNKAYDKKVKTAVDNLMKAFAMLDLNGRQVTIAMNLISGFNPEINKYGAVMG